jgi:hypothetical protein
MIIAKRENRRWLGVVAYSILFVTLVASLFSCKSPFGTHLNTDNKGTITITPEGTRTLSEINVRQVIIASDGTGSLGEKNYATQSTISRTTSFLVDPGVYYVFFRYYNTSSGVSGWWQTTSAKYITVNVGDTWLISYGYYGGSITKQ